MESSEKQGKYGINVNICEFFIKMLVLINSSVTFTWLKPPIIETPLLFDFIRPLDFQKCPSEMFDFTLNPVSTEEG